MTQHPSLLCSVIVPVYNGQTTITRCLDALAGQTTPLDSYEVIVVDDGSTDASRVTVEAWIARHGMAHWRVVSQPNAGPAAARNHGAALAQSPLLLFTDADCVPAPQWVHSLIVPFVSGVPLAAVMGRYLSQQREAAARFAQNEFEERYALMARHAQIDTVATYAAAYSRAIFLQAGGFDISFPKANNEDVELSYRLSKAGQRMIFAPDATVFHPHLTTWRGYFKIKMERAYWRMQVYRRYPEKIATDSYTPQTLKAQIVFGLPALLGIVVAGITGEWQWLLPFLCFLAVALPTLLFMVRRDPAFILQAFWGLWLRSLAFAAGVSWGILRPYAPLADSSAEARAAATISYE